jgi:hypothetical protein
MDFGKNVIRPTEKGQKAEPFERKLPPEPRRTPVEKAVPLAEVLNRKPD